MHHLLFFLGMFSFPTMMAAYLKPGMFDGIDWVNADGTTAWVNADDTTTWMTT